MLNQSWPPRDLIMLQECRAGVGHCWTQLKHGWLGRGAEELDNSCVEASSTLSGCVDGFSNGLWKLGQAVGASTIASTPKDPK